MTTVGLGTNFPSTFKTGKMSLTSPNRSASWALHGSQSTQPGDGLAPSHVEVEEVGGVRRRRAVLGAGLAEPGEVARQREIAGHADFLATADPHAVDPVDDRFIAGEDRRDHVVEEPHVLAVLAGPPA